MPKPVYQRLRDLGERYVNDLKENAETRVRVHKEKRRGHVLSFIVKRSKMS